MTNAGEFQYAVGLTSRFSPLSFTQPTPVPTRFPKPPVDQSAQRTCRIGEYQARQAVGCQQLDRAYITINFDMHHQNERYAQWSRPGSEPAQAGIRWAGTPPADRQSGSPCSQRPGLGRQSPCLACLRPGRLPSPCRFSSVIAVTRAARSGVVSRTGSISTRPSSAQPPSPTPVGARPRCYPASAPSVAWEVSLLGEHRDRR